MEMAKPLFSWITSKKGKRPKPLAWGRLLAEHSEDESDGGDEGGDESDWLAEQSYEMTDGSDN